MGESRRTEVVPEEVRQRMYDHARNQDPDTAPATPSPTVPAAVSMPNASPAMPAFMQPAAPAPAPTSAIPAPFADEKGLMDYVMGKYRALGPVKGVMIQNVLSEIGCKNIKDVTADMYAVFFHKVEAIS
jgi:hypothetical protein